MCVQWCENTIPVNIGVMRQLPFSRESGEEAHASHTHVDVHQMDIAGDVVGVKVVLLLLV